MRVLFMMVLGFSVAVLAAQPENVPELMTTFGGEKVSTVEQWEKIRAPELLKEFVIEEYGKRPVERPAALAFEEAEPDKVMMEGKAIRKRWLPIGITVDERICAGAMYAKFLDRLTYYVHHPELLETPPENVRFEEGNAYSLPKTKDRDF